MNEKSFAEKYFSHKSIEENTLASSLRSTPMNTIQKSFVNSTFECSAVAFPKYAKNDQDEYDPSKLVLKYTNGKQTFSLTGAQFVNLSTEAPNLSCLEYYDAHSFPFKLTIKSIEPTEDGIYPFSAYKSFKELKSSYIKAHKSDVDYDIMNFYNSLDRTDNAFTEDNLLPSEKDRQYKDIVVELHVPE